MTQQPTSEVATQIEREAKREIKLSNGDIFIFPEKFKGKHRRGFERIRLGLIDEPESFPDKYPEMIKILADEIKDKEGNDINIDLNYIDDLSMEDYLALIENGVTDYIVEITDPKVSTKT